MMKFGYDAKARKLHQKDDQFAVQALYIFIAYLYASSNFHSCNSRPFLLLSVARQGIPDVNYAYNFFARNRVRH